MAEPRRVLEVADLSPAFPGRVARGSFGRWTASAVARPGEVLGLVGGIGLGKTTLGKTVLGSTAHGGTDPRRGRGHDAGGERELRPLRRNMQMVFQDPLSSFNPRRTIEEALRFRCAFTVSPPTTGSRPRCGDLLRRVGLLEASGAASRMSSRAASCSVSPSLARSRFAEADRRRRTGDKLDVSVRAQILNLFRDMQRETGVAMLFITHDLRVARYLCDRIAVMYFGKIVEIGATEELSGRRSTTTRALARRRPRQAAAFAAVGLGAADAGTSRRGSAPIRRKFRDDRALSAAAVSVGRNRPAGRADAAAGGARPPTCASSARAMPAFRPHFTSPSGARTSSCSRRANPDGVRPGATAVRSFPA